MHIRRILFLVAIFITLGYFIYGARGVLFFPSLIIYEPENGAIFATARFNVAGHTEPQQAVLVYGKKFVADENGIFAGTLTVHPGYTEIQFMVEDRFGNTKRATRKIVVVGD